MVGGERAKALAVMLALAMVVGLGLPAAVSSVAVWTDKEDYAPGETVRIFGSGFDAGAEVTVTIVRPNRAVDTVGTTADEHGDFTCRYQLNGIEGTYLVTAHDGVNTASTTFTDAPKVQSVSVAPTSQSVTQGTAGSYTVTVTRGAGADSFDAALSVINASPSIPAGSITFTPQPIGFPGRQPNISLTSSLTIATGSLNPGRYEFNVRAERMQNDYEVSGIVTLTVHPTAPDTADVTFYQAGVGTGFTGTVLTVDGTKEYGVGDLPKAFTWAIGSIHDFAYHSPLEVEGTRYVWSETRGLSTAQSGSVTGGASGGVTGYYKTQYKATVTAIPSEMSNVPFKVTYTLCGTEYTEYKEVEETTDWTEWVDAGSSLAVSDATAYLPGEEGEGGVRYRFSGFSPAGTVSMTEPKTVTLVYVKQYCLTLETNPSGIATPSGEGWYDEGAYASISTAEFIDIVAGESRYRFDGWTTAGMTEIADPSAVSTTVSMDKAKTVTANYVTQYYLTLQANPPGAAATLLGTGWYDAGANAEISARAKSGWRFLRWEGDVTGNRRTTSVEMSGPKFATAVFGRVRATRPFAPPAGEEEAEVIGYASEAIDPARGGRVVLSGCKVVLDVPAGATDAATTFSLGELAARETPLTPGTLTLAGKAYWITAENEDGDSVTEFAKELTLTFYLVDENVDDWEDLTVMYYDKDLGWIALATTVDPKAGTVTATFDHLTVFGVFEVDMPEVAHGAQRVVMLIGDARYTADHVLHRMDVAPFIEANRTFVPVRFLAGAFGAEADWQPKGAPCEVVTLTRPDRKITIRIHSKFVEVEKDGEVTVVKSDVAAFIKDGRTMLPFRVIAEAFGAEVDYGPKDAPVRWVSFEQ